ncbi:MAG: hypothetical protein V3T16_12290 [Gemmatimonadales bacterium]
MRVTLLVAIVLVAAGCDPDRLSNGGSGLVSPPSSLNYTVEPSGTPGAPTGLVLRWNDDGNPDLAVWHVYSRGSRGENFGLRGSTTSNSFHDEGIPHLEYYVTAEAFDGGESGPSPIVVVDERLALPAPAQLSPVSLDGAVALVWNDNAFESDPQGFSHYRVYSTGYDLDVGVCLTQWTLEGTTVAPEFIASALTNGAPRCFGISSATIEGWESLWSPIVHDTPRPDARNRVLFARQVDDLNAGFRFWQDLNGDGRVQDPELGLGGSGSDLSMDFTVDQTAGGLFLTPIRAGTGVEFYAAGPVADLTSIDYAPVQQYQATTIQALAGWGYVWAMDGGDGFARFGSLRVTHVGRDLIIFDWAFQTDPGNPELLREME